MLFSIMSLFALYPLIGTIIVSTHPCSACMRLLFTLVLKLHLSHLLKTRSNDIFVLFLSYDRCCCTIVVVVHHGADVVAMVEPVVKIKYPPTPLEVICCPMAPLEVHSSCCMLVWILQSVHSSRVTNPDDELVSFVGVAIRSVIS